MTIAGFQLLTEIQQNEEVSNHGVYVLNYQQGSTFLCDIYAVSDFFVKLCQNLVDSSAPKIITFSCCNDLRLFEKNCCSS